MAIDYRRILVGVSQTLFWCPILVRTSFKPESELDVVESRIDRENEEFLFALHVPPISMVKRLLGH